MRRVAVAVGLLLVAPAASITHMAGVAHADEPATSRDHAEDVADYTLRATLDPVHHTVHGEGTLRWRNTSTQPAREIWVHLYMNAFKNERSVFLREPVGGFRGGQRVRTWGSIDVTRFQGHFEGPGEDGADVDLWKDAELHRPGDEDETDVRVPLGRAVAPGTSATFAMTWDVQLPNVVERTGFDGSFHMVAQWFPKIARREADGTWAHFPFHHLAEFYADFGTYDVTLDVPESFVVGATGPVVETHRENGRVVERHVQGDVHDFAWTAWDRFVVRDETMGSVAVRLLAPPGYEAIAARELDVTRFALPYFSARYGGYPYPTLTIVHPPFSAEEAGGMEYPTLITTGGEWFQPPFVHEAELVTVHELGHQWFYGMLSSDEVTSPFLDEGINSFAEADVMRARYGAGSIADLGDLQIDDFAVDATLNTLAEHDGAIAEPAFAFATGSDYALLVYERTATVLETLRRVYGDDRFRAAMRAYTATERFAHPTLADLRHAVAAELGAAADRNLGRALVDKGWVDYRVVSATSEPSHPARGLFDRDGKRDTVSSGPAGDYEGSVLVERRGTLAFPVVVETTSASGEKVRVVWDADEGSDSVRLPYRSSSPLVAAEVDPDHAVLLDDDRGNNFAAQTPPHVGAPGVLERATYWFTLVLQALEP